MYFWEPRKFSFRLLCTALLVLKNKRCPISNRKQHTFGQIKKVAGQTMKSFPLKRSKCLSGLNLSNQCGNKSGSKQ